MPNEATPTVVISVLIFLFSLASRGLVTRSGETTFDVHGHLYFAQVLREQRRGPFGQITLQVVGASGFSQPFMWHWLLSFFKQRSISTHQASINGIIDSAFALTSYLLLLQAGFDQRVAIYAVALYLLTPMWFSSLAIGPRIAGFTPRLSSEIATNLFFVVTLLPIGLPMPAVQILAVALATFVLSSSKFGVQVLLFLTPLISLLAQRWQPMLALMLGFGFTLIVSRGRILGQFKAQLSHLVWYFRENLAGRMHVSNRNSFRALFKRSEPSAREYAAKFVYRVLSENSYTSVIVKLPALLVIVPACIVSLQQGTNEVLSAAPVLAAVILYFLVNSRPLLFLGESERYLNHVAFFITQFAAQHAVKHGSEWILWLLLVYGLIYWTLESFVLTKLKPARLSQRQAQDALVLQDLRQLPETTVVLCYPYHAGAGVYQIMSATRHRALFCFGTSAEFAARFNSEYAADYPYIKLEKLDEMAEEYGIGYLVLDRRDLQTRGFERWKPSAQWIERTVGGDTYDVYSRPATGSG